MHGEAMTLFGVGAVTTSSADDAGPTIYAEEAVLTCWAEARGASESPALAIWVAAKASTKGSAVVAATTSCWVDRATSASARGLGETPLEVERDSNASLEGPGPT